MARPGGVAAVAAAPEPEPTAAEPDAALKQSADLWQHASASVAGGMIQRQPAAPAAPPAKDAAPAAGQPPTEIPPEVARQIALAVTVLRQVPPLSPETAQRLNKTIGGSDTYMKIRNRDERRAELEELTARGPTLGNMGQYGGRVAKLREEIAELDKVIQAELAKLGVADADELRRMVEEEFPKLWVDRGKAVATTMLNQNAQVVQAEKDRYAGVCSADTAGLKQADGALFEAAEAVRGLQNEMRNQENERESLQVQLNVHLDAQKEKSLPGGVPPTAEETHSLQAQVDDKNKEIEATRARIQEDGKKLEAQRAALGLKYPVLLLPDYYPGGFHDTSGDELSESTGEMLDQILKNIEKTKANIADSTIRIWDLRDVPELAFQSLNVPANSPLRLAVKKQQERFKSDQKEVEKALMVLSITAAIVITVATAGGATLVALGAMSFGAGMTLGRLIIDVQQYRADSAAAQVALDPAMADILTHDPNLLAVVIDLVSLGLEVAMIVGPLRAALRAAAAAGDVDAFAAAARRALSKEQAEQAIDAVARRVGAIGKPPGPYTTLSANEKGVAYTAEQMTKTLFKDHPNIPGIADGLAVRGAAIVPENLGGSVKAIIEYVEVTGPNGAKFYKALIKYQPDRATLSSIQHEMNHLLDLQAGRLPPSHALVAADAAEFETLKSMPIGKLMARSTVRFATMSALEKAVFIAQRKVAELRNALRDLEEFAIHEEAGSTVITRQTTQWAWESKVQNLLAYRRHLTQLYKYGNYEAFKETLTEVEKATLQTEVRGFVESQFPELASEMARVGRVLQAGSEAGEEQILKELASVPAGETATIESLQEQLKHMQKLRKNVDSLVSGGFLQYRLRNPGAEPPAAAVTMALGDRSPGTPLDASVRSRMNSAFRRDLSDVRVHTDDRAATLAGGLAADAFTRGKDVYFAAGKYNPGTPDGDRLLSHELTHVVQQGNGRNGANGTDSRSAHEMEREADEMAEHVATPAHQRRTPSPAAAPHSIQRRPSSAAAPAPVKKPVAPDNPADYIPEQIRQLRDEALPRFQAAIDAASETMIQAAGIFVVTAWTMLDSAWSELQPAPPAPAPPAETPDTPATLPATPTAAPPAKPAAIPPAPPPAAPPVPPAPATRPATATPPAQAPAPTPPAAAPANDSAATPAVAPPSPELVRAYESAKEDVLRGVSLQRYRGADLLGAPQVPAQAGDITLYLDEQSANIAWVAKDTTGLLRALQPEQIGEPEQWRCVGLLRTHINPWEFTYMLRVVEDGGLMPRFSTFAAGPAGALSQLLGAAARLFEKHLVGPNEDVGLVRLSLKGNTVELLQPMSPKEIAAELYGDPSRWKDYLFPYNRGVVTNPDAWLPAGTSLILDLELLSDRYRTTFQAAAQARARMQKDANDFSIVAQPAEAVMVGHEVVYTISLPRDSYVGDFTVQWWVENDPAAVREKGVPPRVNGPTRGPGGGGSVDRSCTLAAAVPGNHVVKAQITSADDAPQVLSYTQTVMTFEEKAAIEFAKVRRQPLEYSAELMTRLKDERAKLGTREDKREQREELDRQIEQLQAAQREAGSGIAMRPLHAVYISKETMPGHGRVTVPLSIFVADDPAYNSADRGYHFKLWDFTMKAPRYYTAEGGQPSHALSAVLAAFADKAPYPTGQIRFEVTGLTLFYTGVHDHCETHPTHGGDPLQRFLANLSTALLVVGVVAAGLGQVEIAAPALILAGIAGGAAAGARIADRLQHGDFQWDVQTGLDILDVAAAVLTAGQASAALGAVRGVGRLSVIGSLARGVGYTQIAIVAGLHSARIAAAVRTGDQRQVQDEILSALASGALFLVVHRASKAVETARRPGVEMDPADPRRYSAVDRPPPGTPGEDIPAGAPAAALPPGDKIVAAPGTEPYNRARHAIWAEQMRARGLGPLPDLPAAAGPELPPGRFGGDFADPAAAEKSYLQARARARGREVGMYFNPKTGNYAIMVGGPIDVGFPGEGWEGVLHNHPNRLNAVLLRGPAPQDVQHTVKAASDLGKPVTEFIEFDLPDGGRQRSAFTAFPDGRVQIEYRHPDGTPRVKPFQDIWAFTRYWTGHKIQVRPGTPEYEALATYMIETARQMRGETISGPPGGEGPVQTALGARPQRRLPTPAELEADVGRALKANVDGKNPLTDFAIQNRNLGKIADELAARQAALQAAGQGGLLPKVDPAILDLSAFDFIDRTPALKRGPSGYDALMREAVRRQQRGDPRLYDELLTFLSGSGVKGKGTRMRDRRPDTIEFRLGSQEVQVTDTTRIEDPINARVHEFKTKFYGEALRALMGGQGPAVQSYEHNPALDIHRQPR